MENNNGTRRQLTFEDRQQIEIGLSRGDRISWIARTIDRTQKVVTEEIKRNSTDDPQYILAIRNRNICVKMATCEIKSLCKGRCMARCSRCKDWLCNSLCPEFEAAPCPKLDRIPFCCNCCKDRYGAGCRYPYRFYEARWAQQLADNRRREARMGIDCDPEAFEAAIAIIERGLALGQSPEHIIAANPGKIPFSVRSLYNYLGGAKLSTLSKLDLPRAVRYKPRAHNGASRTPNIPRALLEGRRWSDFCALPEVDRANAVEMDTVVGRNGVDSQCILTLKVVRLGFQFYILLPDKTSQSVVAALDQLQDLMGKRFSKIFGLLVTDRGTEFSDVERIEYGRNGVKRCSVYFCDPSQSQQKPHAERNHVELRRVLPKGKTDFDKLTERDMAHCMSHVNSYLRGSMDWTSPVEMARLVIGHEVMDAYGVERIDPKDVNLTPQLVPHAILKH